MSIAYDTIAPRYARHRDGHAFVIAILDRLLAKFPGGSVLEVGSGTGVYATGRADAGARTVYAMDLSRQMLRQAPVRDPVVYLQGRATNLPFADHGIRSSHRPLARHLGCSPSCGQSDPERHQPHVNTIDRSGGCRQDNIFRWTSSEEQAVGRIVEIGILREAVEILDEPWPAPEGRIGRIKHRNGENVAISFDTLQDLMEVAREARRNELTVGAADCRHRGDSYFTA